MSSRCVTKMSFRFVFKTSFGHLQDVLGRCLACLNKTSLRYLIDVSWIVTVTVFEDFVDMHVYKVFKYRNSYNPAFFSVPMINL